MCRSPLRWRHNGHDGVSNHQPRHCLLNRLFGCRSKKTSKLRVTGLCAGNSPHKWPVTRKMFPFDDVIMVIIHFAQTYDGILKWKRFPEPLCREPTSHQRIPSQRASNSVLLLSGVRVPDFFDRNKILSGYDLSHYQVPHCIRVFFYFVWFVFIHHNFQFYFKLCTYCNILDIYLS